MTWKFKVLNWWSVCPFANFIDMSVNSKPIANFDTEKFSGFFCFLFFPLKYSGLLSLWYCLVGNTYFGFYLVIIKLLKKLFQWFSSFRETSLTPFLSKCIGCLIEVIRKSLFLLLHKNKWHKNLKLTFTSIILLFYNSYGHWMITDFCIKTFIWTVIWNLWIFYSI